MYGFVQKKVAAGLIAQLAEQIASCEEDLVPEELLYASTKDNDGDHIAIEISTHRKEIMDMFEGQLRWDEDGKLAD